MSMKVADQIEKRQLSRSRALSLKTGLKTGEIRRNASPVLAKLVLAHMTLLLVINTEVAQLELPSLSAHFHGNKTHAPLTIIC